MIANKDSQGEMVDRPIKSSLAIHDSSIPTLAVKSLSMIDTVVVVSTHLIDTKMLAMIDILILTIVALIK